MTVLATPDELSDGAPLVECVVAPSVVAAVAAHAAVGVSGVVRLEPRLTGLVSSLMRTARQRVKGIDPVPSAGVRCTVVDGRARVEVDVVTAGLDQAVAVAQQVQRTVARAVTEATGLVVTEVAVSVLDIDTVPRARP